MNVALLWAPDSAEPASTGRPLAFESAGRQSEWIDPEGDDWLAEIYREITASEARDESDPIHAELPCWFG